MIMILMIATSATPRYTHAQPSSVSMAPGPPDFSASTRTVADPIAPALMRCVH